MTQSKSMGKEVLAMTQEKRKVINELHQNSSRSIRGDGNLLLGNIPSIASGSISVTPSVDKPIHKFSACTCFADPIEHCNEMMPDNTICCSYQWYFFHVLTDDEKKTALVDAKFRQGYCNDDLGESALSAVRDAAREGEQAHGGLLPLAVGTDAEWDESAKTGRQVKLIVRERQLLAEIAKSAALREEITKLSTRLDDSQASEAKVVEELARTRVEKAELEQLVCDFQASGMIDVYGMKGPCEVKPIHIENHVTELRAELARERERHQELRQVVMAYMHSCKFCYDVNPSPTRALGMRTTCYMCAKANLLLAPAQPVDVKEN